MNLKFLLVKNGIAFNVLFATQAFIDSISSQYDFAFDVATLPLVGGQKPDIGWAYDGVTWTPAAIPNPPLPPDTYRLVQMVSGDSVDLGNLNSNILLAAPGLIATLTVTMPPNPRDGQEVLLASNRVITALTLNPSPGQSIVSAITTLGLGGNAKYKFVKSSSLWFKIG